MYYFLDSKANDEESMVILPANHTFHKAAFTIQLCFKRNSFLLIHTIHG